MNPTAQIKLPNNQVLDLKDKNAGYSLEVIDNTLYLKNSAGENISNVDIPSNLFSQYEFTQKPVYLEAFGNLFSVRPNVISILNDENTIRGRLYIYELASLGMNEFDGEVGANVSINAGDYGLVHMIFYNLTDADVRRSILGKKVTNDIKRTGGTSSSLLFRANINSDTKTKFNSSRIIGSSIKSTGLYSDTNGSYGSTGLSGNDVDFLVTSNHAFSANAGDKLPLTQNVDVLNKIYLEFYDTDDNPFVTNILNVSNNYVIRGKNINSARITSYNTDGTILEQKTYNSINNELNLTTRATNTGESSAVKIEISNQATFAELQHGYYEFYDELALNTIVNLT